MNWAKVLVYGLAIGLVLTLGARQAWAEDATKDATKSVTGKATCGGCSGVVKGCCVMLTDTEGVRWILRGDSPSLKKAFAARHDGKTMTAKLAGEATKKTGKDGKEYKEAKVKEVKIAS